MQVEIHSLQVPWTCGYSMGTFESTFRHLSRCSDLLQGRKLDVQTCFKGTFERTFRPATRVPLSGCLDLLQGYLWADVQTCYKGTFEWMFRPATRVPLMALGSQPTEGTGVSACTIPGTRAENNHNHKTATKQQQTKQNRNKNNNSKNHTYTQQDRRFFFKRYLFVKTDYNPRMC